MSYTSIHFPGSADYLRAVRRFTRTVVGDVPGVRDVVQVANELAANAILHTASGEEGGTFVLHLATFTNRWQVRVDDMGGMGVPRMCTASEEDEAGRGLTLVAALSESWGVLGDCYARAVWAEISKPEEVMA